MFLISDLCALADVYLEPHQVKEIYRAYLFGAEAHEGQHRASGEPYIHHPIQVARILVEMRLDYQTIVAAILHDVIEDTETAKAQIAAEFGEEVAELVDGVSKLTQISFRSKAEAQAENFRKMLLAMARDIRVILVKLADRLHNMRTLSHLPSEKSRQIARETLEIYAPIANRLGLNSIRQELEDLGFQALYPMRYRVLAAEVRKTRGHRKQVVRKIETAIKRRLRQEGLSGKVAGREKHLYSLYRKMREKGLSFSEVLDVYAFRVNVDTVDACYRALGILHNLYKPVPGKFKDYIALPKANGYQSLHTVLFGPYGSPLELQIRTDDMHAVAEAGIAAHWRYKASAEGSNTAQERARQWIKELLEMQSQAGDSMEFIENVKVDLFPKEVYVFTPAGDIMELPRGATAVDLAYAVHTDVGNTCIAVKIDGRYAPLRTQLSTGQNVEVVTAPWGRPNANWLTFVVTGKARAAIRKYLKDLRSEEAVELGRRLLTQSLAAESLTLDEVAPERIGRLLAELHLETLDALLEEIGLGKRPAPLVTRRLTPGRDEAEPRSDNGRDNHPLFIKGSEGMVVSLGKCCHPIPGDPVLGFVSTGRGIVIHTAACRNIAEYADKPEKWVDVEWEPSLNGDFPVEIRVDTANQKGVLATVAAAISDMGANIENVSMESREGSSATLNLVIGVTDRVHLAHIIRRIRHINEVARITRTGS
ncbi:MAG: bifunctional GTP diphosphokinase/guanosine-3',5'-bis pyrophosphate 3'-pyrophosphohydrolase [Gammaproteobacteria bacterium]|nr:bifunctional GTP diphosphokinase/guanosine-3',5'-bis pyrophosphate 3'-pyrophosphohydrolase [Gammaproteobacteria bacterium]